MVVGEIEAHSPFFKIYNQYCASYAEALEVLARELRDAGAAPPQASKVIEVLKAMEERGQRAAG